MQRKLSLERRKYRPDGANCHEFVLEYPSGLLPHITGVSLDKPLAK